MKKIIFLIFIVVAFSLYSQSTKIFFKNINNWNQINAYVYSNDADINEIYGAWPGKEMKEYNKEWYYVEFAGRERYYVIFNNGLESRMPQKGDEKEYRGDLWFDGLNWYDEDPKYLNLPEIIVEPQGGVFSNDSIDVYVNSSDDAEIEYTTDDESWKRLNAGLINISLKEKDKVYLKIKAKNNRGSVVSQYLFKKGIIPIPIVRAVPSGGSSDEDFLLIDLIIEGSAEKARYAIDNQPWIQFNNNCTVVLDMKRLRESEDTKIKVYAENLSGVTEDTFTYTKKKKLSKNTKIHMKNIKNWDEVYIYSYQEGKSSNVKWPGEKMEPEGNRWFGYDIEEGKNNFIVFSNGKGEQFPDEGYFLKSKEEWFNGYFWSEYNLNKEFSLSIVEKESEYYGNKKIEFSINGDYKEAKYTINGENPKTKGTSFLNGQELNLKLPQDGEEIFLRVYISNGIEDLRKDYRYKIEPLIRDLSDITVYNIPLEVYGDGSSKSKLRQLEDELEYLHDLGFNAISINPFYNRKTKKGFKDSYSVNTSYGKNEDLKSLIKKAHDYGVYLFFTYDFSNSNTDIIDSRNRKTKLSREFFEDSSVLNYYKEVFSFWIDEYEIDGWDFYGAKIAGKDFINSLSEYIKKIGQKREDEGEYWGIYSYISADYYRENLKVDTVQDNSLRNFTLDSFAVNDDLSKNYEIDKNQMKKYYVNADKIVRLGDLIQRAGYDGADYYKRYKAAFSLLTSKTGVLNFYYGDELGADVDKFIFSKDNGILDKESYKYYKKNRRLSYENQDLRSYLQNLLKLRKTYPALSKGEEISILKNDSVYARLKVYGDSRILYVLNLGKDITVAELDALGIGGRELMDLENSELITEHNLKYNIIMEAMSGRFFLVY